mmetsp:Transcript_110342/g.306831  ORF Transcript_110342/g.306831 Transcript_110342/m.306831 type:complete len:200 (-) Transcript_110342:287-886(-)
MSGPLSTKKRRFQFLTTAPSLVPQPLWSQSSRVVVVAASVSAVSSRGSISTSAPRLDVSSVLPSSSPPAPPAAAAESPSDSMRSRSHSRMSYSAVPPRVEGSAALSNCSCTTDWSTTLARDLKSGSRKEETILKTMGKNQGELTSIAFLRRPGKWSCTCASTILGKRESNSVASMPLTSLMITNWLIPAGMFLTVCSKM